MKSRVLQVFEHGYLHVSPKELSPSEFNQLVHYNDQHEGKYFEVGHKRIRFQQYVGAIQVGRLVIEILPKADKRPVNIKEADKWRKALLDMLHQCKRVKVHSLPEASLAIKNLPLMDVYLRQFVSDVEGIVHKGLLKAYRKECENENKLRGRLVFNKHVTKNLTHKERFYTEHTTYDFNNIHNQVLAKALSIVGNLTASSDIKSTATRLLLSFENIDDVDARSSKFDRISRNRKTGYYDTAIDLALMIIKNHSPDIRTGSSNVLALLFDMNTLFEDYVYRVFKRSEQRFSSINLNVSKQVSSLFWGNRSMRPDIVLEYKGERGKKIKVILDTKWKNISDSHPSFNDLRQMYAYNIHLGGKRSVLIYPNCNNKNTGDIAYANSEAISEEFKEHSCQLYFVDLLTADGLLDAGVGARVIESLIKNTI